MTSHKTPLLLITGFLGSGKTTLINRFLHQLPSLSENPRLGVVVNEFGQVGIDGALLGPGDIVEMGGGCICCATGEELWESALSLVERNGATHLLVETSGIADPEVLLQQYQMLSPSLKERIELQGVLCLIDSIHFAESFSKRKEAKSQINSADKLLFTKIDLLSSPLELTQLHQFLDQEQATQERLTLFPTSSAADLLALFHLLFSQKQESNPKSSILNSQESSLSFKTSSDKNHSILQKQEHKIHEKGQLQSFCFSSKNLFLKKPLAALFQELNLLRAKGFVYFADSEQPTYPSILHVVGNQVEWSVCKEEQASKAPLESTLVFIGENINESWLYLRLQACTIYHSN